MQIDTQPLQVLARRLNVPRVIYGVGGTAVGVSQLLILKKEYFTDPAFRMYEMVAGTYSESSSIHPRCSTAGPSSISLPINSPSIISRREFVRCPLVANN